MTEVAKAQCATCGNAIEVWISSFTDDYDGIRKTSPHWRHEDQHPRESDHDIRPQFPLIPIHCEGCGSIRGWDGSVPAPLHCDECPPWRCRSCGAMDSHQKPCSCWVSLKDMPIADIKGLFARDGLGLHHNITPEAQS